MPRNTTRYYHRRCCSNPHGMISPTPLHLCTSLPFDPGTSLDHAYMEIRWSMCRNSSHDIAHRRSGWSVLARLPVESINLGMHLKEALHIRAQRTFASWIEMEWMEQSSWNLCYLSDELLNSSRAASRINIGCASLHHIMGLNVCFWFSDVQ